METLVNMKLRYENSVSNMGQQVTQRTFDGTRYGLSACHQVATTLAES